jgi:hypothetical protein
MDAAGEHGHMAVLDWWVESGNKPKYSELAMSLASDGGHVHVLYCWAQSGLGLKYFGKSMDRASMMDHVDVFDWWLKSGCKLEYSAWTVVPVSGSGGVLGVVLRILSVCI